MSLTAIEAIQAITSLSHSRSVPRVSRASAIRTTGSVDVVPLYSPRLQHRSTLLPLQLAATLIFSVDWGLEPILITD